jgi:hypothetical protein
VCESALECVMAGSARGVKSKQPTTRGAFKTSSLGCTMMQQDRTESKAEIVIFIGGLSCMCANGWGG